MMNKILAQENEFLKRQLCAANILIKTIEDSRESLWEEIDRLSDRLKVLHSLSGMSEKVFQDMLDSAERGRAWVEHNFGSDNN